MKHKTISRILSLFMTVMFVFLALPLSAFQLNAAAAEEERYTVLVLDTSSKADFLNNGSVFFTADTALSYVKTASERFLDNVRTASGNNHVAVVSFKANAQTLSGFTQDFDQLKTQIRSLTDGSVTRDIASGLRAADALMDQVTDENAIKNIVLFTTGMTNEGDYSFSGHYGSGTIASDWYRIDTGINLYAYANIAYDQAQAIKDKGTYIYTIGLFQTLESMPDLGKPVAEFFRLTARELATSDRYFYPVDDPDHLEFTFGEVADEITSQVKSGKFRFPSKDDHDFEADYFFDEAYFAKPATDNHNYSLATMTLCFVLSAFGSNEAASYQDKPKNALALLNELEFDDIEVTDTFRERPSEDSMAAIFAHKDITVNGEPVTLIAVSTRGGGYEAEWAGNFTVGAGGRHTGFNTAATYVEGQLANYVNAHMSEFQDNVKLWIGGYSRGAATANLTAADITHNGGIGNLSLEKENIYAFCFEPPMGENIFNVSQRECASYNNIHNIVNPADVVTKVAMGAWGFTKYGVLMDIIPSDITDSDYNDEVENMLRYYNALDTDGVHETVIDGVYQPRTFQAYKFAPDLNLDVNFDPGLQVNDFDLGHFELEEHSLFGIVYYTWRYVPGNIDVDFDPSLDINLQAQLLEETNKSMAAFLDDLTFDLAVGFETRLNYTATVQPTVRALVAQLMGNGYEAYKWKQVPDIFENKIKSNIGQIAATLVLSGQDEAVSLVTSLMVESIVDAGLDPAAYLLAGVAVKSALESVGRAIVTAILTSGTEDLITVCANGKLLMPCHFPELCLAWLQSKDDNYTEEGREAFRQRELYNAYRVVHINCPVDVRVYDETGRLVAAIIDNVPQEIADSSIVAEFNSDGEKRVYLPADMDYRVEIIATGDGTLNYAVNEYSYDTNANAKIVGYYNIPITEGDVLNASLAAFSDEEAEYTGDGSNVSYTLNINGSELTPNTVRYAEEAAESYYTVTADTEQDYYGNIIGGGIYTEGEFAQVSAVTFNGNTFEGWYENGELLSQERTYRFLVQNDRTLEARFDGQPVYGLPGEYTLTLDAQGGSVAATPAKEQYAAGEEIRLTAAPADGMRFVRWEAEAGTFADANAADTTFTMPEQAVTVKAVFEEAPADPEIVTTTTTTAVSTTTSSTSATTTTATTTAPAQSKPADTKKETNAMKTGDTNAMPALFLTLAGGITVAGVMAKKRKKED